MVSRNELEMYTKVYCYVWCQVEQQQATKHISAFWRHLAISLVYIKHAMILSIVLLSCVERIVKNRLTLKGESRIAL